MVMESAGGSKRFENHDASIIHDLALTAPEEVVIGNALVDQSFHMDSPNLSIDGDLLLEGRIQD